MRHRQPLAVGGVLLVCVAVCTGCNLLGEPGFMLDVPYRSQDPESFDCGPASVQMWRAYDGLPEVSQQQIGQWMGGTSCGASQEEIAAAVNHFTNTSDAYWDFDAYLNYQSFLSRQITSVVNFSPVIAIVDFNHAGVVNGGEWSPTGTGYYRWEYTYFHDPLVGPNVLYGSGTWIDLSCPQGRTCEQIISFAASAAWGSNLSAFGSSVIDDSGCSAAGCGPENQDLP